MHVHIAYLYIVYYVQLDTHTVLEHALSPPPPPPRVQCLPRLIVTRPLGYVPLEYSPGSVRHVPRTVRMHLNWTYVVYVHSVCICSVFVLALFAYNYTK